MSDSRTILPAPKLLNLVGVRATENSITLAARTSSRVAFCPICAKRSVRVHSRYTRTLADLPPKARKNQRTGANPWDPICGSTARCSSGLKPEPSQWGQSSTS
jgi:hypothetical protein